MLVSVMGTSSVSVFGTRADGSPWRAGAYVTRTAPGGGAASWGRPQGTWRPMA